MLEALLPAFIILPACLASGGFLVWLVEASPARRIFHACRGLETPVLSVVAVMFALLSAFMASEVWARRGQAVAVVQTEVGGLRSMLRVANALGPAAAPLREAALDYTRLVIEREWPDLARRQPHDVSAAATQRFYDLLLADGALQAMSPTGLAMAREALSHLREARTQRLRLAASSIAPGNWLALCVMAFLTQAALCAIHMGKPRPMLLAMALFSAGAGTLLAMLALNDEPFFGFAAVTEAPFRQILSDFGQR